MIKEGVMLFQLRSSPNAEATSHDTFELSSETENCYIIEICRDLKDKTRLFVIVN